MKTAQKHLYRVFWMNFWKTCAISWDLIFETKEEILDEEIEKLIEERQVARKERNFQRADEIRAELLEKGIVLEDTREGVKWKRA